MGYIKTPPNLFLESAELNRFKKFLDDWGFRRFFKFLINKYGIIPNKSSEIDSDFLVAQDGVNEAVIIPGSSFAINKDDQIIIQQKDLIISLVRSADPHWIKISHQYSPLEEGTIMIDESGNMSGTDTRFLEVLRGQPNFPIKIILYTDSYSILEYEVLRVMTNTTAILQGEFQIGDFPAGTRYAIIGTFDYDSSPPEENKKIYQYDDCLVTVLNQSTQPVLVEGYEFLIASVINESGNITITDLRKDYMLETKGNIDTSNIALLDKENIFSKYQSWNQTSVNGYKSGNSVDKNLILPNATTGFITINMITYDGYYNLEGILKNENTPYNLGAILIIKMINIPSALYWSYPYDSNNKPVGFEDYTSDLKDDNGNQVAGRALNEGDILIVQQISYSWDPTTNSYKTRWRILTNLYADTKDIYSRIKILTTQIATVGTKVFISGQGGISDTNDADNAGAKEGDIFIS